MFSLCKDRRTITQSCTLFGEHLKALVKKDRMQKGHGVESVYAIQDTFNISSKDSVAWLEMEKNTDYTICTDDVSATHS